MCLSNKLNLVYVNCELPIINLEKNKLLSAGTSVFIVSWYILYLAFLIILHASAGLLFCFIALIQLVGLLLCLLFFRYRIEYEALSKVESEQNEFIDQFILQKWGCDWDSRKLLRPHFQSACPVFSERYPFQRITLLQLFFWSNPKAPTSS